MKNKLSNLRTRNPKEYWKILNTNCKKQTCNADLNDLFTFYKNCYNTDFNEQEGTENIFSKVELDCLADVQLNHTINQPITHDEVFRSIKMLKNNKASGEDRIFNEYIKATYDCMLNLYTELFNMILDSGVIPTQWICGNIVPIYKNKGDSTDPQNYRPITLLSCLGKLFTAIINERLNKYSDSVQLILENQAGFRRGLSTTDNIFSLYSLIELFKLFKKKLYCAFIDFEKAFDSVWHIGLWNKILQSNIDGKCFRIISNIHKGIKSKVVCNGASSEVFNCTVGVRQGENLSPFLFSLYLNDLEDFLSTNNVKGLNSLSQYCEKELNLFLHLFVLLYADDTILLAENAEYFQHLLNTFSNYCKNWHLKVNSKKTKVVIFGRGKNKCSFTFEGLQLELVDSFKYLGVTFSKSNSFNLNIKELFDKATKAMYGVIGKCRKHNLTIDCKLDMFDKVIKPILLYGCEVWGYHNSKIFEKLHLKFCKHILNLKSTTPNFMVYGELGRYPLIINIKVRIISFWGRLVNSQCSILSAKFLCVLNNYKIPWIEYVQKILNECGLNYVWHEKYINIPWLKSKVHTILLDQFKQSWHSELNSSAKGLNYRLF